MIFNFFRKNKTKIKVVDDSDLLVYLKSLGVLEVVQKEKVKCEFCGDKITIENLEGVFPQNGEIKFFCSKPKCFNKLSYD